MSCLGTYKTACLATVSVLMLSACSDKPSTTDVQDAFERLIDETKERMAYMGADMRSIEEVEVKVDRVSNCEVREKGSGYICDVEYSISSVFGEVLLHENEKMELMQSSWGWEIIE